MGVASGVEGGVDGGIRAGVWTVPGSVAPSPLAREADGLLGMAAGAEVAPGCGRPAALDGPAVGVKRGTWEGREVREATGVCMGRREAGRNKPASLGAALRSA